MKLPGYMNRNQLNPFNIRKYLKRALVLHVDINLYVQYFYVNRFVAAYAIILLFTIFYSSIRPLSL